VNGAFMRSVKSLEISEYSGPVFNLWVDVEHSYMTPVGAVKNCHPRDQIALSWLARELQLSSDLFEDIMLAREGHARRLASMLLDAAEAGDAEREIWILGTAYKPGVAIETGSHALLVDQLIAEQGAAAHTWDPHRDSSPPRFRGPAAILIGCAHPECFEVEVPEGSVVLDPFRRFPDRAGVEVRRLGEGRRPGMRAGFIGHGVII